MASVVPLLLHLLGLVLQLLALRLCADFNPQHKQYDTIIRYLYPGVLVTGDGTVVRSSTDSSWLATRRAMLTELWYPRFFSVFACVEVATVLYVWGELLYPPVYCGAVRPLSLYYYPVLMSLLDLMKFNIYVAVRLFTGGRARESLLALLNAEMFMSSLWTTLVLGVYFALGLAHDLIFALLKLCGMDRNTMMLQEWPVAAPVVDCGCDPTINPITAGAGAGGEKGSEKDCHCDIDAEIEVPVLSSHASDNGGGTGIALTEFTGVRAEV